MPVGVVIALSVFGAMAVIAVLVAVIAAIATAYAYDDPQQRDE